MATQTIYDAKVEGNFILETVAKTPQLRNTVQTLQQLPYTDQNKAVVDKFFDVAVSNPARLEPINTALGNKQTQERFITLANKNPSDFNDVLAKTIDHPDQMGAIVDDAYNKDYPPAVAANPGTNASPAAAPAKPPAKAPSAVQKQKTQSAPTPTVAAASTIAPTVSAASTTVPAATQTAGAAGSGTSPAAAAETDTSSAPSTISASTAKQSTNPTDQGNESASTSSSSTVSGMLAGLVEQLVKMVETLGKLLEGGGLGGIGEMLSKFTTGDFSKSLGGIMGTLGLGKLAESFGLGGKTPDSNPGQQTASNTQAAQPPASAANPQTSVVSADANDAENPQGSTVASNIVPIAGRRNLSVLRSPDLLPPNAAPQTAAPAAEQSQIVAASQPVTMPYSSVASPQAATQVATAAPSAAPNNAGRSPSFGGPGMNV